MSTDWCVVGFLGAQTRAQQKLQLSSFVSGLEWFVDAESEA